MYLSEERKPKNMGGSTHRKRPHSDVGTGRKKPAKRGSEMTERMSHHIIQQVLGVLSAYTVIHRDRQRKKDT